jgi:uncharacterized surface protein with fasciclin (FAS1) repeats
MIHSPVAPVDPIVASLGVSGLSDENKNKGPMEMKRRTTLKMALLGSVTMLAVACAPAQENNDIVDIAASNPEFSTLVAAVEAAGLVDTLKSAGPFTVFAPTDAAFAKLPAGTVESLLEPENRDQLVSILTYHVVPGFATSEQLVGRTVNAETAQGSTVRIDGRNGVKVDDATVTSADILASNGVIHVIDTVIVP